MGFLTEVSSFSALSATETGMADRCTLTRSAVAGQGHRTEVSMASPRVTEILATVLSQSTSGTPVTACLVNLCGHDLPVTGVGLALMTDEGPAGTVAATDDTALELEDLQFTLGEGPCVAASTTGRPVLQPELSRTAPLRWPAFAAGAEAAGLAAVFALPLQVGAIRLGVLDLYRTIPGVLSPQELADALCFAEAATTLLLHAQAQNSPWRLPLESLTVLDDRAEVHQATGVVSVHADVTLQDALLLLRARAYADQRPIAELAKDVLNGLVDFRTGGANY
jgi:hypothetical protein